MQHPNNQLYHLQFVDNSVSILCIMSTLLLDCDELNFN